MKKFLFIAATAMLLWGCTPKSYTIKGDVEGLQGTVYLVDEYRQTVAETNTSNGKFTFKGTAEVPGLYTITDGEKPISQFFLENGKIKIIGSVNDLRAITVTGTTANDRYTEYSDTMQKLIERYYQAEDEAAQEAIIAEDEKITEDAINNNLDNYFGLHILEQASRGWEPAETLRKLNEFSTDMQNAKLGTDIRDKAMDKMRTEPGNPYIDITLPDVNGNPVSLSTYVGPGKYVLIDFWASWCNPCMGEVPYLVSTYEKYHAKGFEIFGVSLDRDGGQWREAISKNKMNWVQTTIIGAENPQAPKDYAVTGIPANFLISPEGIIVAKNLRGEEVEQKITELLGK